MFNLITSLYKYKSAFSSTDISTEEGRGKQRLKLSLLTSLSSIFGKALNMGILFISIPLCFNYLGKEQFGLWITFSSIISIFTILGDFGLGNTLINKIAQYKELTDKRQIAVLLSNTFIFLAFISLLILISFLTAFPFINLPEFFKLSDKETIEQISPAILTLIALFLLNLPFTVVDRFLEGLQLGYINNVWQSVGNIIGLVFLLYVIKFKLELGWLILATYGIPVLFRICNFIYHFYITYIGFKINFVFFNTQLCINLIKLGGFFLILNLFNILGTHSDILIITHYLGAKSIALFGMVQKFTLLTFIVGAYLTSLWPAYAEAAAKGDLIWIKSTISKSLKISLLTGTFLGLVIFLYGNKILHIWTGKNLNVSPSLLFAIGVFCISSLLIGAVAVVMNSGALLKKQMPYYVLASVISLLLKFYLLSILGIAGVIWATIIAYCVFYLIPAYFLIKKQYWREININNI